MSEDPRAAGLAELLTETGRAHHAAFAATDGDDPEWPLWYAEYLHGKLGVFLDPEPTRSRIVQLLLNADDARTTAESDAPWPDFFARLMLAPGSGSPG